MRARVDLRAPLPDLPQPSPRRGEGARVWGIIPQRPDAHFLDAGFSLDPLIGAGRVLPLAGEGWRQIARICAGNSARLRRGVKSGKC